MTSLLDAPGVSLRGSQTPRIFTAPPWKTSAGQDAVDLAAHAGLILDPWQALVLEHSLGERADGKWAAFECCVTVPRQCGKGSIIEARELAGLFILGERLILHSAHEFKTAAEGFRRIESLIEGSDDLRRKVKKVMHGTGERGIELKTGQRLLFIARSKGSGRGLTADCVIFDEAYNLGGEAMGAMLPTLSSIANPQVWYLSSAGHPESEQLHAVRRRGIKGGTEAGALAYFEWSAPDEADPADPRSWAQANPALGIRISEQFVLQEMHAMPEREFARERLGIWEDTGLSGVFDLALWASLADPGSAPSGALSFGLEVSDDRAWSVLAAAGGRSDGLTHCDVVSNDRGTGSVVPTALKLQALHPMMTVHLDPSSQAGSLAVPLRDAGVPVVEMSAREVAQACGVMSDAVGRSELRHLGQAPLDMAVAGARRKVSGDAYRWDRRGLIDIAPLAAVTLAVWAHVMTPPTAVLNTIW